MLGALLCVLSIFGPISRVSVNGLHYTAGAIPYRASENGINHAQDNGVSWDGLEVFPAQAQRVAQVGKVDLANDKGGRDAKQLQFGSCEYCGHSSGLLACDRNELSSTGNPSDSQNSSPVQRSRPTRSPSNAHGRENRRHGIRRRENRPSCAATVCHFSSRN